jgi:xanthine dehydrogenase YagT iron-sulfur-binding subunit
MQPSNSLRAHAFGNGAPAPDFELGDPDGRTVCLSELRGQPVILAFYPPDWDPTRADQLGLFNTLVKQVPGVNAELLGISRDGVWCDLAFADQAMRVPLLADLDPQGAVAECYGVSGGQALFVIDADGVIRWSHVGPAGVAPSMCELVAALSALAPSQPDAATPRRLFEPSTMRLPEPSEVESAESAESEEVGWGFDVTPSRREFVATALAAAFALAAAPLAARAEPLAAGLAAPPRPDPVTSSVTLRVNGRPVMLNIEPRVTLLDALREYANLTGTKKGCDHGQCGACTVHVNGRRTLSCLTFAMMHQGDEITTVEGLASNDQLHPMQAAFIEHDGFQCGYCTSGQIMSATALLKEPCGPSDADVKECMSGNLCRCGAYPGIVAAIQDVRAHARG